MRRRGIGEAADVEFCEENGCLEGADPRQVSDRAKQRGRSQLGTLGSGNHFLEVQYVEKILESEIAEQFGLEQDQVVVLIHCGSRGLGHQVCTDYLKRMDGAMRKHGITMPDRQLACVPANSAEGQEYLEESDHGHLLLSPPPSNGEVAPSYGDGGVNGNKRVWCL